jgi:hypothetical protein
VIALAIFHFVALVIQEQEQKGLLLQQLEKLSASISPAQKSATKNTTTKV